MSSAHILQCHIPTVIEHLEGWLPQHPLGSRAVQHHCFVEEIIPNIQSDRPLAQLEAITSCTICSPLLCVSVLTQVHGQGGFKFQNWAKTYGSSPELYFQPTSVEEIREVRRSSQSLLGTREEWPVRAVPLHRVQMAPSHDSMAPSLSPKLWPNLLSHGYGHHLFWGGGDLVPGVASGLDGELSV